MLKYISVAVLILLVGCASMGSPITKNNSQIIFPHYSVAVPPDKGWRLVRPNETNEVAVVTLKFGPPLSVQFRMLFMKNDVLDERVRSQSAQHVADDYRNMEKRTMIEQGVNKGEYQLSDVVMGEETVGGKKFYTMKYTTSNGDYKQNASLYLYFPRQEKNPYFIVVHYSETMPSGVAISTKFYPQFLETLKSLRVNL